MPQIDITLPSGAKGRIRGLKGKELNLFANRAAARRGKTGLQILNSVWLETTDPGPLYTDKVDWSKAPQCDRFTALFYARIATFGSEYEFRHQCGSCGKKFTWAEDLDKRPIKPLPDESADAFVAGNKFSAGVVAPEGDVRKVVFQMLTPKLEDKIEQAQNLAPAEKTTAALAQRIVSIEGVESGKGPVKVFLNELDAGSLFDLMEAMDDVDGGIDTNIEIYCVHCGEGEELELPLGRAFWTPERRKRSTTSTET